MKSVRLLPIRSALGIFFAMLFVLANSVASSDLLHHWLHDDSDSSDHDCPITTLAQGQEIPGGNKAVAEPARQTPPELPCLARPILPRERFLLLPERAPPAGV
ncbi:MAG: hypothetical protein FJ387_26265 [Verrucomicrobia bacterium]|nr:hypothetical protein [Verrucomicrobiota bacterium]